MALLSTNGVSESTIASRLIVTKGDVLDVEAVRKVLFDGDRVAGIIISGIGRFYLKSLFSKFSLFFFLGKMEQKNKEWMAGKVF